MAALFRHESGEITDEMVDVFGDIEVTLTEPMEAVR